MVAARRSASSRNARNGSLSVRMRRRIPEPTGCEMTLNHLDLRASRRIGPSMRVKRVCHTSAASPDPTTRADSYRPPRHHRLHRDFRARTRPRGPCRCVAPRPRRPSAERFHARAAGLRDRASRGSGDNAAAARIRRLRLPQQSPRLARACSRRIPRRGARLHRAPRRRSRRAHRRHIDLEHRRDRRRLSRARTRPLARTPAPFGAAHAALAGIISRSAARHARTLPHRRDRVFVEREDLRQGRAHDSSRRRRCGDSRRRRYALRQRAVRLQRARARLAGAVPPVRSRAQRHLDRRSGRLRAASNAAAMRARRA